MNSSANRLVVALALVLVAKGPRAADLLGHFCHVDDTSLKKMIAAAFLWLQYCAICIVLECYRWRALAVGIEAQSSLVAALIRCEHR